jgi:hypothetical protein
MASPDSGLFEPTQESSVEAAPAWVSIFYPDVAVEADDGALRLTSLERDQAGLRLIWLTVLTNERLLARGAAARAQIIDALVR